MKNKYAYKKPLHVAVYARVGNAPPEPLRVYSNEYNLLSASRAGQVDHLIVESITRLGRNTVESLGLLRELQGVGVKVHLLREGQVV